MTALILAMVLNAQPSPCHSPCHSSDTACLDAREDQLEIIIGLCDGDKECWRAFWPQPVPTGKPYRYLFEKRINRGIEAVPDRAHNSVLISSALQLSSLAPLES